MDASYPTPKEPSAEELKDLEKLRAIIEQAIADGKLTQEEMAAIKKQAWADGKITSDELELYSTLILDKIRKGELTWDF